MIVSYAQNFEDVILWRALNHISCGHYIDIGAQEPAIDSVSMLFYEHGWRGIHVEPNSIYAAKLRAARPDEIVVEAALGASRDRITFYEVRDTGLSTSDTKLSERYNAQGLSVTERQVDCRTLAEILDMVDETPVHWMKVDVEGMEHGVLSGWGASTIRPWIVVVESTEPLSQVLSHSAWEPLLFERDYEFVYFDGLNRFYVHCEHPELKGHFGPGPNVFDNFALAGNANAPFCARLVAQMGVAEQEAAARKAEMMAQVRHALASQMQASQQAKQAEALKVEAETRAGALEAQVARLLHSRSWRITAPLRQLGRLARQLFVPVLLRWLLHKAMQVLQRHHRLKTLAKNLVYRTGFSGPLLRFYDRMKVYTGTRPGMTSSLSLAAYPTPFNPRAKYIAAALGVALTSFERKDRQCAS